MANKTMSEKHKPARKSLRVNEYYNPKTKRYEYRYTDTFGKKRVISSYRLEATDQVPKGKRVGKSLREKEAEIQSLLENDINIDGSKLTLIELLNEYLETLYNRKELRYNTKRSYDHVVKSLEQHKLGHMEIGSVKPVHCEKWLTDMKKKYRGSTLHIQITLIKRAFEYAVDYDYVVKNPFRRIYTDTSDSKVMGALSIEDMNRFLDFCKNDPRSAHCYEILYILFWTGLRVSELCGLTLDNIDMERHLIRVEKQLQFINRVHVVLNTKTTNGIRTIPMTDGVYECFKKVLDKRYVNSGIEPVCYDQNGNAYDGFVFLGARKHNTIVRSSVSEYLENCIRRYNAANPDKPIRKFEAHTCRHTFATNMQDLPPKTLQSILGHSDIRMTMNRYVSAKNEEQQLIEVNAIANSLA